MVMHESEFTHRAAEGSLPLRGAFAVLFFVAVYMLFEPSILVKQPQRVLAIVSIIILGKSLAAILLVLILRYPLNTALTVAASLVQIGEFSFILAGLGAWLGIMSGQSMSLILAGALISISLNPLIFTLIAPFNRWIVKRSTFAHGLEFRTDTFAELPITTERKFLEGQVVLVGYGLVGRRIARVLSKHSNPYVVAEQNRELVESLP